MESTFKFLFFIAIILAALIVVGLFLLVLKVLLMFQPELNLLGLTIY